MSDAGAPGRTARVFAAFLAAHAFFGLAYLVVTASKSPLLWYRPLERSWEYGSRPSAVAMGWYGTTLAALVAAAAGGAITFAATASGRLTRALSKGPVMLALARVGAVILVVDFAYFGWALTHQTTSSFEQRQTSDPAASPASTEVAPAVKP